MCCQGTVNVDKPSGLINVMELNSYIKRHDKHLAKGIQRYPSKSHVDCTNSNRSI